MDIYKNNNSSIFNPDKIILILDTSIEDDNKDDEYNDFFESSDAFLKCFDHSLNYDQIHLIFQSFKRFIRNFPDKLKEHLSPDLCIKIQSFINENLVTYDHLMIIKDSMIIIAYICSFDTDFIPIFTDNNIIDDVITVYSLSTHELYESMIILFDCLLVNNVPQAIAQICNFVFSSTNNYCLALGMKQISNNVRVATSFFYSLVEYPSNIEYGKILSIFQVVVDHIKWNEQSSISNDIFVFTLWIYASLLKNYSEYTKVFVTEEIVQSIGRLLEDDFGNSNESDEEEKNQNESGLFHKSYISLEKNPQRPLLAIYRIFFMRHFEEPLFQLIVESTSFPRLIELTKSDNSKVAIQSFGVLKQIIIHHTDLIDNLMQFDLIPCLIDAFENSFSIKKAAFECVCELLVSNMPDVIFEVLTKEIFLLSAEYISTGSENEKKVFLEILLKSLTFPCMSNSIPDIIDNFSQNNIFDILDDIFDEQPIKLVTEIQNILNPED